MSTLATADNPTQNVKTALSNGNGHLAGWPSTTDLYKALDTNFGFNQFKGEQEAIINSIMQGRDTLVIMPTGGGKSLCYQLPAVMSDGIALVISPLIALMKNQVDLMRGYSENDKIAHYMNSSLNRTQLKQVKEDLVAGHTKLLYVAPETLTKDETVAFYKTLNIKFVAIDEAHCISEWGHDFRTEYRRIREMVTAINDKAPIIALTATATPKVRTDIIKNLQLKDPAIFISSFNRANLYYEIRPKQSHDGAMKQITKFIQSHSGKSGIIYCLNRKKTEDIAEQLCANGIKAAAYHAGLDPQTRARRQDGFLSEDIHVICATIAFGMGIDKPDVRFVIHYNMPKSLENYYQETGRAGRDGQEGICLGFFSHKDMSKLEKFMRDKPANERDIGGQHLIEMTAYAKIGNCRRKFLLNYFGEEYGKDHCDALCDNCHEPKKLYEVKEQMQLLLTVIKELQEQFDSKYIIDFICGENPRTDFKHDKHPLFGKGKHLDIGQNFSEDNCDPCNELFWESLITQAILYNFVKKDIEQNSILKITERGQDYFNNPKEIKIALNRDFNQTTFSTRSEESKTSVLDPQLMGLLKDTRKTVAKKKNVPTFAVFQDRSLEEMATYYPITLENLEHISGVSQGKARKYGRPFIRLIAQYVEDNNIDRPSDFVMKTTGENSKGKLHIITNIDKKVPFDAIQDSMGWDFEELLHQIERIVESGTKLHIGYHIDDVLDDYQQEELFEYFTDANTDDIPTAYRELDEEYTEEEIRLMRIKFMVDVAH